MVQVVVSTLRPLWNVKWWYPDPLHRIALVFNEGMKAIKAQVDELQHIALALHTSGKFRSFRRARHVLGQNVLEKQEALLFFNQKVADYRVKKGQAGDDEALAALSIEEKRRRPLVIQRGQDVRWENLLGVADGVIEPQPDLLAFGSQAQSFDWLQRRIDQVKETMRTLALLESLEVQMEYAPDSELRSSLTEHLLTAEFNEEIRAQACSFRAEEWAADCDRRSLALRKEAAKQKRKLGRQAKTIPGKPLDPEEPHHDVFPIAEEKFAFWKVLRDHVAVFVEHMHELESAKTGCAGMICSVWNSFKQHVLELPPELAAVKEAELAKWEELNTKHSEFHELDLQAALLHLDGRAEFFASESAIKRAKAAIIAAIPKPAETPAVVIEHTSFRDRATFKHHPATRQPAVKTVPEQVSEWERERAKWSQLSGAIYEEYKNKPCKYYSDRVSIWPDFAPYALRLLGRMYTSVECETFFSRMRWQQGLNRLQLGDETLNALLRISLAPEAILRILGLDDGSLRV
jgi:hypothetical protein